MDNPTERRVFSRINFDGRTYIEQNGQQWAVKLLDISLKGLLTKEPENWTADTHQPMNAIIELNDEATITMHIHWRHSNAQQLGFECLDIDIDSITHLRRLVELNLGDEALLERELASLGG